jgi:hypothetical protein
VPALGQAYTAEGPQFGNTLAAESQNDPVSVSTGESGHFESVLTVKADTFKEEAGKVLKIQTIYEHLSLPSYGVVDLIPETGISIISGRGEKQRRSCRDLWLAAIDDLIELCIHIYPHPS